MELGLSGKTALVCASSAGIGKAIALGLAKEGANVAILGRDEKRLATAKQEIQAGAKGKVFARSCDLRDLKAVEAYLQEARAQLGPIDILVNNQGGPAPGNLLDLTDEQIQSAVQTNLLSVLHLTRLCVPDMKARKWGRILHILSISAKESLPNMLLSNTLRPAILGVAKTLAIELAPHGITVNSLLPAAVLTERAIQLQTVKAEKEGKTQPQVEAEAARSLPIGRIASPEECAQLAIFLAGATSSYVSGAAIPVDAAFSKAIF